MTPNANMFYLGDGVYAWYDGFQFVMETEDNKIYLDSSALTTFLTFVEKIHNVKIEVKKKNESADRSPNEMD